VQRLIQKQPLDAELVAAHVRALQVGPLAEVVSTDRHLVKPWFQGRLDYAPPVFDLATEGFPLTGGRVEHVRGDPVATLAYARNRHVIDLTVWPSAARTAPTHGVRRGFNLVHWADGSMQYWAVSDLERGELENFAQLWIERTGAQ
jgi:anti-sigma factor RsiW